MQNKRANRASGAGKGAKAAASDGQIHSGSHIREVLLVAEERGLLSGGKTHVIRGRMPVGLVEQAKRRSGISSDSKLLEAALANIAVFDEYADWLLNQRGTVDPKLNLEF